MNPILKVSDLSVTFTQAHKKIYAVRNVSFEIFPRETIAVVGESGSGKSVMIKALVKLFSPNSANIEHGQVLYNHINLLELSEKKLQAIRGREIGIIFQDPMTSLNPTMTVGKQVLEGIRHHYPKMSYDVAKQKVLELFSLVGIQDSKLRYDQYPHELSGGMRQRIMIAIALAPSPKILIADEPTTALDVTVQAQILRLLKEIQQKTGTSILLITHDMSIVAGFCDKALVMYAGKIIEKAPVDLLFYHPQHPYTQRLLQSLPRLDLEKEVPLKPIKGSPPDLSQQHPGCSFAPRCSKTMEICTKVTPSLYQVCLNHQCACWRLDLRAPKELV
jgi:oligopeptide transport system ATP-binding protein